MRFQLQLLTEARFKSVIPLDWLVADCWRSQHQQPSCNLVSVIIKMADKRASVEKT